MKHKIILMKKGDSFIIFIKLYFLKIKTKIK